MLALNSRPVATVALIVTLLVVLLVVLKARQVLGKDIVRDPSSPATTQPATAGAGPLAFVVKDIDGNDVDLAQYRGKVVMFVNVASKCGFTSQYAGLEMLYRTYKDRGLVIVGVPANNFGGQEPGSAAEIKQFCSSTYDVTFPLLAKVSVKGDDKGPLYKYLTEPATAGEFAGEIGWNFTKFLVDHDGRLYARFASQTKPDDKTVIEAVEKGLGEAK